MGGDLTEKPISQVKVGEYVMNKDKTEANEVVFVEKFPSGTKVGKLYTPVKGGEPFATSNHMLEVDGKWVLVTHPVYPWLEYLKCENAPESTVIHSIGDTELYNLWVSGDGTYIVNGYGTHSIMFDGGWMVNCYKQGLLDQEGVMDLMNYYTGEKPELLHGSFLVNRLLGKVNVKLLNRLWIYMLCADDSTTRKKLSHLTMRVLQKIRRIV